MEAIDELDGLLLEVHEGEQMLAQISEERGELDVREKHVHDRLDEARRSLQAFLRGRSEGILRLPAEK